MFDKEANLKGSHRHILKVPIYIIIHFLIPIRVSPEDLSFPHGHRQ